MAQMTHPADPRGLIREAYRIEGITLPQCRTIFLDWAIEREVKDSGEDIASMLEAYGKNALDHPMSTVLREGIDGAARPVGRRGGWRGRR